MGVITKMMARPELPADCAFAQQLQEPMLLTYYGQTVTTYYLMLNGYYLLLTTCYSLQELMRSC